MVLPLPRARVLLVEPEVLLRESLALALEDAGYTVVGQADDAREGLRLLVAVRATLVLCALELPDSSVEHFVQEVQRRAPGTAIVLLGQELTEAVAPALGPSVAGYAAKQRPLADLLNTLEAAVRWQVPAARAPTAGPRRRGGATSQGLTAREREVAVLIAQGLTNRQIAEALYLSPLTVRNYAVSTMRKLGIHRRAQLAAIAVQLGWLPP